MIRFKRTKIVATVGPSSEGDQMLTKLVQEGLDVMRVNLSHGNHKEHQKKIDSFRRISKKTRRPLGILVDLAGPKIRIGDFKEGKVNLKKGQVFVLATKKIEGDQSKVFVNYRNLPKEVKKGDIILLEDGKKTLRVTTVSKDEIKCRVVVGGELGGRRGVNIPKADLSIKTITKKDKEDIVFAARNNVEFVALSFVREASDIIELRNLLKKAKSKASIIAKIETAQAIKNLDAIIEVTDGVMVARGDLALEIPAEVVPRYQKQIIDKCKLAGKPVITATQMFESMMENPHPTRAEVSDVANAIYDGTDAVMLSGETALGKYPLEAVKTMARVALEIEKYHEGKLIIEPNKKGLLGTTDSVTTSAVAIGREIGAKLIIALTESGFSARMVSRHHSEMLIIALSPDEYITNRLSLSFGCHPVQIPRLKSLDDVFKTVRKYCLQNKLATKGDKVIIVAGAPFNQKSQRTNMLLIEKI